MPRITLDQWQAFVGVVDSGSYHKAAEALHKSQSTITYAVKKIEELLEVGLFTIEGRKAILTDPGRVLYGRGRALLDEAGRVERAAQNLAAGWEAELRIAVDALFPTWLLLECMARFAQAHPQICIELYESVLDGTNELLLQGEVNTAITSLVPPGFLGDPLMRVRAVLVAAPGHPLHQLGRAVTSEDLRAYRHIFVRDSGSRRARNPAWQGADQRWTVSHKATSIRAVCMGLGFAWFAEEMIRHELANGALKPLPLAEGAQRWGTLYLVHADRLAVGRGAKEFEDLIREAVAGCPNQLMGD